ncbi:MAG: YkgJ family cysteine cluster protein [Crocinitomicaceae bacterium]|nr:YkgJ family cysteine cluster protein [Crocinitomicaceae bacterium]
MEKANTEKESIRKVIKKISAKKPKDLDANFQKLHTESFKKIDCLTCANCCKTTSPIFRDIDIKRISKNLRMKENEFVKNYLKMDEEKDYVLQSSPCAFLGNDNKCDIYEFRPLACREYPHTDRKNMHQILDLTVKNTEICPAVAEIVLQITNKYV